MSTETVLFYIFSGAIAMAYMIYGKKQRKAVALLCGLGLLPLYPILLCKCG